MSIVQCYVPTNRAVLEAKEEFYEQLKAVMDNSQGTQAVDMNAKVGRENRERKCNESAWR